MAATINASSEMAPIWQSGLNGKYEETRELTKKNLKNEIRIKELERELNLLNKPLPKRPSKFKILKEKTKSKFQQLTEKVKHQSQELIARIEVRVK